MPCHDFTSEEENRQIELSNLRFVANTLTKYLCATFKGLEDKEVAHLISLEARDWWELHKELDLLDQNKG